MYPGSRLRPVAVPAGLRDRPAKASIPARRPRLHLELLHPDFVPSIPYGII